MSDRVKKLSHTYNVTLQLLLHIFMLPTILLLDHTYVFHLLVQLDAIPYLSHHIIPDLILIDNIDIMSYDMIYRL